MTWYSMAGSSRLSNTGFTWSWLPGLHGDVHYSSWKGKTGKVHVGHEGQPAAAHISAKWVCLRGRGISTDWSRTDPLLEPEL